MSDGGLLRPKNLVLSKSFRAFVLSIVAQRDFLAVVFYITSFKSVDLI